MALSLLQKESQQHEAMFQELALQPYEMALHMQQQQEAARESAAQNLALQEQEMALQTQQQRQEAAAQKQAAAQGLAQLQLELQQREAELQQACVLQPEFVGDAGAPCKRARVGSAPSSPGSGQMGLAQFESPPKPATPASATTPNGVVADFAWSPSVVCTPQTSPGSHHTGASSEIDMRLVLLLELLLSPAIQV